VYPPPPPAIWWHGERKARRGNRGGCPRHPVQNVHHIVALEKEGIGGPLLGKEAKTMVSECTGANSGNVTRGWPMPDKSNDILTTIIEPNLRSLSTLLLAKGIQEPLSSDWPEETHTSSFGEQVELVEPPEGAVPGERVTAAGFEGDPVAVLKKEAFDPIAGGLKTNSELVACYQDQPLVTSKGPCTVRSVRQGAIR